MYAIPNAKWHVKISHHRINDDGMPCRVSMVYLTTIQNEREVWENAVGQLPLRAYNIRITIKKLEV